MTDVKSTAHAIKQARARYPGEFPADHAAACRIIAGEVTAAQAGGRMAKHLPRWAVRDGATRRTRATSFKGQPQPSCRYVWTEDERRIYMIDRGRDRDLVVTCIRPDSAKAAA